MFLPENLHIAHLDVLETYDNALLQPKKNNNNKKVGKISNKNALAYYRLRL